MKVFELGIIGKDKIELDNNKYKVIKGKHSLWIPEIEVKLVCSINGRIESRFDWDKGGHCVQIRNGVFNQNSIWHEDSLRSIREEIEILNRLSKQRMAPKVGEVIYIKNIIWDVPFGVDICDNKGMYGYEMQDANKLKKGKFSYKKFKAFAIDKLEISKRALGDVMKPNNSINGYLVDVRRTFWDTMRLKENIEYEDIIYKEDIGKLKEDILKLSQFPYGKRKQNYQSYFLNGDYVEGSRDTIYRFDKLGIKENLTGKNVVDLGCQLGTMAMECYRRGARNITGVEYEKDYVNCARRLARTNGFQINFRRMDLKEDKKVVDYINRLYPNGVDILFTLALYKHINDSLWVILKGIDWKVCYVESHSAKEGLETPMVKDMINHMNKLNCKVSHLGEVTDRSKRVIWRLEHE